MRGKHNQIGNQTVGTLDNLGLNKGPDFAPHTAKIPTLSPNALCIS